MSEQKIIFSGEHYGAMLRGELCNKFGVQCSVKIGNLTINALTIAHRHEKINHIGYAGIDDNLFLIIHLN